MKLKQVFSHKKNEEEQQIEIIKNSEYFDAKWYLEQNPDIKKRKMSAARHYLKKGWQENRNPSPKFNTQRYLKKYPECKICPLVFEYNRNSFVDLSICAIMKNEAPYVKEWIDYHILVGVKRFYIYDNESTDNIYQVLLPYINQGIVVYKYYRGEAIQRAAYNECIKEYQDKTKWMAFIDADEFIVPKEKNTITEFLKDYEEYSGIGINWISFDSNGYQEQPKGGVLENYTRVHYDNNWWKNHNIKSIVKPCDVKVMQNHQAVYKDSKYAVDENKNQINDKNYLPYVSVNKIQVNHYYCKSEAESVAKVTRGTSVDKRNIIKPINVYELNFEEIKYDYSIYKYLVELKPEIAGRLKIKLMRLKLLNSLINFYHWFKRDEIGQYIDEKWYFKQYPEAKNSKLSARQHYLQIGWKQGNNPSEKFDTDFYLKKYLDVAQINICPLLHFVSNGRYERRQILPKVQPAEFVYRENSISRSWKMIRKIFQFLELPIIKTKNYVKKDHVASSHAKNKDNDILAQSEYFDKQWYMAQYSDVKTSGLSPEEHYNTIGWKKGYNPSDKFDTLKYLKQYSECKICPLVFEYNRNSFVDLSIVAIMKNEASYVKEWVDYHRLVGVKRFYIYDNESTDNLQEVLKPYIEQGIVVYKYYPGEARQMPAYNDCIKKYKDKTKWLAVIDADEFIIPLEKENIPEFLKDFEEFPGVGINWISYDSNGHKSKPQGGVLENYTRVHNDEQHVTNHHIKSIIRPTMVTNYTNPHYAWYLDGKYAVTENKQEISEHVNHSNYPYAVTDIVSVNKIRINHYYCKSEKEYRAKIERGRAPMKGVKRKFQKSSYIFDDCKYDYAAYKFVVQLKPQIAKREKIRYMWLKFLNKIIRIRHPLFRNELSKYIDEKWYFEQYPDAKESGLTAKEHYLNIGWRKGYNPSDKFDTNFYLDKNKDVAKANICPLLHYISNGKKEKRNIAAISTSQSVETKKDTSLFKGFKIWCKTQKKLAEHTWQKFISQIIKLCNYQKHIFISQPISQDKGSTTSTEYFDEQWYLSHYPEVKESGLSAREHYNTIGWKKGYNPSENFDTVWYLTKNTDIFNAKCNPLIHYLTRGNKENRTPKTEFETWAHKDELLKIYFNEEGYQREYYDVKVSGLSAREHYNTIGWKKGYNPSKFFNTKFYSDKYKVVAELGINPLEHFLKYGINLGYKPTDTNISYGQLSYEECPVALSEWWIRNRRELLNLENPQTYNEKIQWLKLYDSTPIKTKLADKYLVRDWIKEKIGEKYLIPSLGAYDNFDEIDFDKLPNQFVMKCNHGSGMNIIVKDKSQLNITESKEKLERWLKTDFSARGFFELQYKNIVPKIVIERYIENKNAGDLYDYKLWCFNGRVEYIQFLSERYMGEHSLKMAFYDRNWVKQSFVYNYPLDQKNIEKPDNLEKMIELAEKLAEGFNHVRVDFYRLDDGSLYFGEMTFSSASGTCLWNEKDINKKLGDMIKLPELAYNVDTGTYFKLQHECGEVERPDISEKMLKCPHYNNRIWNNEDYFDENWYLSQYSDVKKGGIYARQHYEKMGWRKGYNPSSRFDTKEYLKQYPECKICPLTFEQNRNGYVDLSICAIMRNEAPYVKEWLDYHRLVGVKRFYIYDNESTDNLKDVLTPYIEQGIVIYKYHPGLKKDGMQTKAYNECIADYRNKTKWLALIDADEFIVPTEKNSIPEFLDDYKEYPGVVLYWVCYDTNGHIEKPKGGVMENYTRCHYNHIDNGDTRTKAIVNTAQVSKAEIHYSHYYNERSGNTAVDSAYRSIIGNSPYNTPSYNGIRINHYKCKSYSEFKQKILKPRVKDQILDVKESYDYSDYTYDYTIYKYVKKMVGKNHLKEWLRYNYLNIKRAIIWLQHQNGGDIHNYIDEKWYLQQYPNYKDEAPNAYEHYLNIGWKKGYNPSLKFSTLAYYTMYPDIARSGQNPLIQYIDKGKREGRLNFLDYFDRKWYLKQYPEVKELNIDPVEHFLTTGWREGKNPNNQFDCAWYLKTYKDVVQSGTNPYIHYIKKGIKEGRLPKQQGHQKQSSWWNIIKHKQETAKIVNIKEKDKKYQLLDESELFNKAWYIKKYIKGQKNIDPIEHYLNEGWKLGYNPSKEFDTNFYLNTYQDIARAGINPLIHYINFGQKEGRLPKATKISLRKRIFASSKLQGKSAEYIAIYKSGLFDEKWYLSQYPEVKDLGVEPLKHYMEIGWKEGKNPSPKFDTKFYMQNYPDVLLKGVNPLRHYVLFGKKEGRICLPPYKRVEGKAIIREDNEKNPKISIIVASYNYEQYIGKTLDSLVAQTYKNFEVIVVDDGSKDNSVNLIKKYVKKYPNVFLHRHRGGANRGLFETIKLGIAKSTGKYIAFCESDDYWLPNNLEERVKAINEYNSPKIIYNNVKLFGPGQKKQEEYIANLSLVGEGLYDVDPINQTYNVIPTFSSVMIDKKALQECDFNAYIPAWTDWWLYRQIMAKYPMYHVNKALTMWRIHESYNSEKKAAVYMEKYDDFIFYNNELVVSKNKKLIDKVYENEHIKLLQKSDLFDEKYYVRHYPEVKKFHLPPIYHYLKVGWKLGYNPSEKFDTNAYLNLYTDVIKMNPLIHYLVHGSKEDRQAVSTTQKPVFYMSHNKKGGNKHVLLASNLLNYTGAPMLLLNISELFIERGYKVTVLSPYDGELRDKFLEQGADVIIDARAYGGKEYNAYLRKYKFDFCLCNTLKNTIIYNDFHQYIPSILWVHENQLELSRNIIDMLQNAEEIYVPSPLTKSYIDKFSDNVKILPYPIKDMVGNIDVKKQKNKLLRIAVCATLSERKGQDIFINAIKNIEKNIREKAEFIILGDGDDIKYKKKIKDLSKDVAEIKFLPAITNQKEYHQFFEDIDILCAPSREDPSPLVVIDAFMHGVPVIVSDHVGQSSLIASGKNGYVFVSENEKQLADIMEEVIIKENIETLRKNSRVIFETYFNQNKFFDNFIQIMEEKCAKSLSSASIAI